MRLNLSNDEILQRQQDLQLTLQRRDLNEFLYTDLISEINGYLMENDITFEEVATDLAVSDLAIHDILTGTVNYQLVSDILNYYNLRVNVKVTKHP